jgi:hypothetical protein
LNSSNELQSQALELDNQFGQELYSSAYCHLNGKQAKDEETPDEAAQRRLICEADRKSVV